MAKTGVIHGINGPVVSLLGDPGFQMNEMVYVGAENLVGEVIGLTSGKTTVQEMCIRDRVKAMERWRIKDGQFEEMAALESVPEAVDYLRRFLPDR